VEEQSVALESDPALPRHRFSGPGDEFFQVRVEQRLADTVQYQCIQAGKGLFQGCERAGIQVAVCGEAAAVLFWTHDAVQVAATGRFYEESGRMVPEGGEGIWLFTAECCT